MYNKLKKLIKNKPRIGICGISYKNNTSLTTKSPGEQLYNYFKNKNKIYVFEKNKIDNNEEKYTIESDINSFFKKSDIIFICYKNKYFNKISNIKTYKKKILIDFDKYFFSKKMFCILLTYFNI